MKDNDAVTFQVNEDIALVQHMKSVFAATQWAAPATPIAIAIAMLQGAANQAS